MLRCLIERCAGRLAIAAHQTAKLFAVDAESVKREKVGWLEVSRSFHMSEPVVAFYQVWSFWIFPASCPFFLFHSALDTLRQLSSLIVFQHQICSQLIDSLSPPQSSKQPDHNNPSMSNDRPAFRLHLDDHEKREAKFNLRKQATETILEGEFHAFFILSHFGE